MSTSRKIMIQSAAVTLTIILIFSSVGLSKPAGITNQPRDNEDPLLALASDSYQISYDQIVPVTARPQYRFQASQPQSLPQLQQLQLQQQQPQQAVQYIVQTHPELQTSYQYQIRPEQPQVHEQQMPSVVTKEEYYLLRSDGQLVREPNAKHDANCRHRHEHMTIVEAAQQPLQQHVPQTTREYLSILDVAQQGASPNSSPLVPSREYPGEVVYIRQNGEAGTPSPAELTQEAPQEGADLSSVANYVSRNSGVAATILTEIPIKDMPLDVLGKLRRDYGVKVVATRERPGANLVINCDDASNQENSICFRPPVYEPNYNIQPQHYTELVSQPHSAPSPQHQSEVIPQHHNAELAPQHHTELVPHHHTELAPQHQDEMSAHRGHLSNGPQESPIAPMEPRENERSEEANRHHEEAREEERRTEVAERAREPYETGYRSRNAGNLDNEREAAPQEQNSRQQEESTRTEEGSPAQDDRQDGRGTEERDSQDAGF